MILGIFKTFLSANEQIHLLQVLFIKVSLNMNINSL